MQAKVLDQTTWRLVEEERLVLAIILLATVLATDVIVVPLRHCYQTEVVSPEWQWWRQDH